MCHVMSPNDNLVREATGIRDTIRAVSHVEKRNQLGRAFDQMKSKIEGPPTALTRCRVLTPVGRSVADTPRRRGSHMERACIKRPLRDSIQIGRASCRERV